MDETQGELTPRQICAIKKSFVLGSVLQRDHPEIADLYRKGYFLRDIVKELFIDSEYGVKIKIAQNGVYCALVGHDGILKNENYKGLLSLEEIAHLGREHRFMSGLSSYDEGKGIHALTEKEKREAGKKGVFVRGLTSWSEDEKREAYELSFSPEYLHRGKYIKGCSRYEKIARVLNRKYHDERPIRTGMSVKLMLRDNKKSLKRAKGKN